MTKRIIALIFALILVLSVSVAVYAADNSEEAPEIVASESAEEDNTTSSKAMAAALCVGVVAAAGAVSMAMAISKTNDGISRQPEASGSLRTSLMLGLVFIETAIIYALIVAILIIFVL